MLVTEDSVSARYGRLVGSWSDEARSLALRLPHRLGLVSEEGGTWDDYTGVRFANDLPAVVVPDVDPGIGQEELELYRMLHLSISAQFLIEDRIADGDVPDGPDLEFLVGTFRQKTANLLARIPNSKHRERFDTCHKEWHEAVDAEQHAVDSGRLALARYGRIVRAKNRYLTLATCFHPDVDREEGLLCLMDGMMVALQCRSDAVGHQEDEREKGCSWPTLLCISPALLLEASRLLMRVFANDAMRRGYGRMAESIEECVVQEFSGFEGGGMDRASVAMIALCVFPELSKLV